MSVRKWAAVLLLSLGCAAQELTVAAASDLQSALPEVVSAYEKKTGQKIRVVFGSSGNFFAQIQNGAPFDVFFSADISYPLQLEAAGLATPGSLTRYAVGRIVMWVPKGSPFDIRREGLNVVGEPTVKRIAIANPAHAPYGRAAVAALKAAKLWAVTKPKVVLGENIAQTAQFVQTGNAQMGFIALSLALSPKMAGAGTYWLVPQELYPRLEQGAVVIKESRRQEEAKSFLAFFGSDEAGEVLRKYGFSPPELRRRATP